MRFSTGAPTSRKGSQESILGMLAFLRTMQFCPRQSVVERNVASRRYHFGGRILCVERHGPKATVSFQRLLSLLSAVHRCHCDTFQRNKLRFPHKNRSLLYGDISTANAMQVGQPTGYAPQPSAVRKTANQDPSDRCARSNPAFEPGHIVLELNGNCRRQIEAQSRSHVAS